MEKWTGAGGQDVTNMDKGGLHPLAGHGTAGNLVSPSFSSLMSFKVKLLFCYLMT